MESASDNAAFDPKQTDPALIDGPESFHKEVERRMKKALKATEIKTG